MSRDHQRVSATQTAGFCQGRCGEGKGRPDAPHLEEPNPDLAPAPSLLELLSAAQGTGTGREAVGRGQQSSTHPPAPWPTPLTLFSHTCTRSHCNQDGPRAHGEGVSMAGARVHVSFLHDDPN